MCVGDIIIGVIGVWGMTNCVWWMCRLADREGGEGSEDRTSLRGVAVNPWPCWLSLQGGGGRGGSGGHFEVRLVQGHMMAGRGGVVRCLIWFLSVRRFHLPHHPSSENRVWEAGQCQREVTYFMSHLKGMVVPPPTKEMQRSSKEPMNATTHSHMFVYKMLLSCFPTINCSFPLLSDTWTMLCHCVLLHLKVLEKLKGWQRPLKGTPSGNSWHKDHSCQCW